MLNRRCAIDADTRSSIDDTRAIGSKGSSAAISAFTSRAIGAASRSVASTICISDSGNWKYGTNTSASADASRPSCLMSATTPTMVRSPAIGMRTSFPRGSTAPKYRRTTDSFTMATFGPVSRPSKSSNTRPRRSRISIVWKYPGMTAR